jgi:hypothetical protein
MNGNQLGKKNGITISMMVIVAKQIPPSETLPMSPCPFVNRGDQW